MEYKKKKKKTGHWPTFFGFVCSLPTQTMDARGARMGARRQRFLLFFPLFFYFAYASMYKATTVYSRL